MVSNMKTRNEIINQLERESVHHPYDSTRELLTNIKEYFDGERFIGNHELLTILMEECAELSVEASKMIRFANKDANNVPTIETEVGDLLCMIDLLIENGLVNKENLDIAKAAKREKLKTWSNLDV